MLPLHSSVLLFLLGLLTLAVSLCLLLKIKGGFAQFGSVYHTVRSWIVLLSILWLGLWANTDKFAFGIFALTLLMFAKGQHEIRRLLTKYPVHTPAQKRLDGVFLAICIIFLLSFFDLGRLLHTQHQLGVLLFVIFAVQANDVGQYCMGRLLGHRLFTRKLAPTLSPKKTIEGAVFGTLLTSLICLPIGRCLTPFSLGQIFIVTWVLTLFGIVGDLLESAVKRSHGVKDMGYWLKGHGGIMDRIDSLLISVPLFWGIYRGFLG